jgi:hypothetical protein
MFWCPAACEASGAMNRGDPSLVMVNSSLTMRLLMWRNEKGAVSRAFPLVETTLFY